MRSCQVTVEEFIQLLGQHPPTMEVVMLTDAELEYDIPGRYEGVPAGITEQAGVLELYYSNEENYKEQE